MSEKPHTRFAEILKQERLDRQMTLEQMANFLGTTKQVLSRYERGERSPKLITAATFAKKLGIPIEAFESDIDMQNVTSRELHIPEEDKKQMEILLLLQKHADTIELLESLPDQKREQALDYLRFLAMQSDKT